MIRPTSHEEALATMAPEAAHTLLIMEKKMVNLYADKAAATLCGFFMAPNKFALMDLTASIARTEAAMKAELELALGVDVVEAPVTIADLGIVAHLDAIIAALPTRLSLSVIKANTATSCLWCDEAKHAKHVICPIEAKSLLYHGELMNAYTDVVKRAAIDAFIERAFYAHSVIPAKAELHFACAAFLRADAQERPCHYCGTGDVGGKNVPQEGFHVKLGGCTPRLLSIILARWSEGCTLPAWTKSGQPCTVERIVRRAIPKQYRTSLLDAFIATGEDEDLNSAAMVNTFRYISTSRWLEHLAARRVVTAVRPTGQISWSDGASDGLGGSALGGSAPITPEGSGLKVLLGGSGLKVLPGGSGLKVLPGGSGRKVLPGDEAPMTLGSSGLGGVPLGDEALVPKRAEKSAFEPIAPIGASTGAPTGAPKRVRTSQGGATAKRSRASRRSLGGKTRRAGQASVLDLANVADCMQFTPNAESPASLFTEQDGPYAAPSTPTPTPVSVEVMLTRIMTEMGLMRTAITENTRAMQQLAARDAPVAEVMPYAAISEDYMTLASLQTLFAGKEMSIDPAALLADLGHPY